jgi:hypothetical protein
MMLEQFGIDRISALRKVPSYFDSTASELRCCVRSTSSATLVEMANDMQMLAGGD